MSRYHFRLSWLICAEMGREEETTPHRTPTATQIPRISDDCPGKCSFQTTKPSRCCLRAMTNQRPHIQKLLARTH